MRSRFTQVNSRHPSSKEVGDWSDVVTGCIGHTTTPCAPCPGKTCEHKRRGRAFNFAEFYPNTARALANVFQVHVLLLDLDHGDLERLNRTILTLRRKRVASFFASSHSHRADAPRGRLGVRLSEPVPGHIWPSFWSAANLLLDAGADPQASDASRLYFEPTCPEGTRPLVIVNEGEALDVAEVLRHARPELFRPRAPMTGDEWATLVREIPDGARNSSLAKLAGMLFRRLDRTPALAAELVRAVNRTACQPPLDDHEVESILLSIARREASL